MNVEMSEYHNSNGALNAPAGDGDASAVVGSKAGPYLPPALLRRNAVAFWLLGLINNLNYCVVIASAVNVAVSFDKKSYVALISWANVACGILARCVNAFWLNHLSYNVRVFAAGIQAIVGLVLLCLSPHLGAGDVGGFTIALIGVTFIGNSSAYGESVALGYMERLPSQTVSQWSAGTGMSGVLGSLMYLGLKAANLRDEYVFLIMIPFTVVYWAMFYLVISAPPAASDATDNGRVGAGDAGGADPDESVGIMSGGVHHVPNYKRPWSHDDGGANAAADATTSVRRRYTFAALWALQKHIWFNTVNLNLVYIFEYACQFAAPFAVPCYTKHSSVFFEKQSYVVLQFCYQLGVLCSRSSLSVIKIRRVWILTVIQFFNMIFWLLQARYLWLSSSPHDSPSIWILFGLMYFVGLMGGASYVNVFHNLLEDRTVSDDDRPMAINIGALHINIGITLGSVLDVIYSNTLVPRTC
jgi:battenin